MTPSGDRSVSEPGVPEREALVSDDLARVRNAVRDVADAYIRFRKATERMAAATNACGGAAGPYSGQIVKAAREGCAGPERIRAFAASLAALPVPVEGEADR